MRVGVVEERNVEHAAVGAQERGELGDQRQHRVALVERDPEHPAAGAQEHAHLGAARRRVGGVDRGLDLDRADPVAPAHRSLRRS
jgi:hypothetical protein